MAPAGKFNWRLRFEEREAANDGYGNTRGGWVARFETAAAVTPLKGGEQVLASRLAGTQPVGIQIRRFAAARAVKADWRAVDVRTGDIYAITSPAVDLKGDRAFLDLMATIGVGA